MCTQTAANESDHRRKTSQRSSFYLINDADIKPPMKRACAVCLDCMTAKGNCCSVHISIIYHYSGSHPSSANMISSLIYCRFGVIVPGIFTYTPHSLPQSISQHVKNLKHPGHHGTFAILKANGQIHAPSERSEKRLTLDHDVTTIALITLIC